MKEYQKQLDIALDLFESEKFQDSAVTIIDVYESIPASEDHELGLAGSIFRRAEYFAEATDCFRKVISAHPLSPRGSLGLFLSLWNWGKYDEALDELERFYSVSKEYDNLHSLIEDGEHDRLLADMSESYFENAEEVPDDPIDLIKELRKAFQD